MAVIRTVLRLEDEMSGKLKKITRTINTMNAAVANFNKGVKTTDKQLASAAKQASNLGKSIASIKKSTKSMSTDVRQASSDVGGLINQVKRLAVAWLTVASAKQALQTADKITSAENKLSSVYRLANPTASDAEIGAAVQGQLDDIYASAQRSRSGYTDAISNIGKMLINAEEAFDGNIDKAIAFNELMSKSYTIGGASAHEQSTSMYQLIQALGSGVLQGDELRSVREGAQVAYNYIEKYAQQLYNTETSLKDLASEGKITADIVTDAILQNHEEIEELFNKTQVTFAQTWEMLKNSFVKAFEPVLQRLTEMMNNPEFQAGITALIEGFVWLANVVMSVIDWVVVLSGKIKNFVIQNADLIISVLVGAMITLIGVTLAYAAASLVAFIIANWQLVLIVLAIFAVVSALAWLVAKFEWVGQVIGAIIGYLIANIWNQIVAVVNFIYGIVIAVYNFIADVVNSFATMFSGGLKNFLGGLAKYYMSFVNLILDGLTAIARMTDAVFGTGIADALQNFKTKANDFIDEKLGVEEKIIMQPLENKALLDRMSVTDSIVKGVELGGKAHDTLSGVKDKLSGMTSSLTTPSLGGKDWASTIGNAIDGSGTGGAVGDIADAVQLTAEDLKYLRELAEMEAINKFTTAEIKIDMTNNNNINGTNDIDGLVEHLSQALYDEMAVVAEGTHY